MNYGGHFDLDEKKSKINELTLISQMPTFWTSYEKKDAVIDELSTLKNEVSKVEEVKNKITYSKECLELLEEEFDEDLYQSSKDEVEKLIKETEELELLLLLNGPYDKSNCIFELHSGAGGTESNDWTMMLFRMYTRYFERENYKYEILDKEDGEETGIKSVSIRVKGKYAYGYLKCEHGVHRLVRLSPFDAANKRHTSFASAYITPEFDGVSNIEIDEKDLKIDVYRSSGCGGQGVNTTDSAVRVTHLPTKTVVTCQNERSQIKNKETAINILKGKLKLLEITKQEEKMKNINGESQNIEFGSQIRSYVLHPYSMIKDHRTNYETSNVSKVLDGDIQNFIESYLKMKGNK